MKYVILNQIDQVAEVTLNREELHNAFNDEFIAELTSVFREISLKDELRLVCLQAKGKSFCAGADLNWMSSMMNYSEQENYKDAQKLEELFAAINNCPIPVLAKVQGHALGGGVGLVSVCDYVLCSESALMGFTEARLGLAPATIAPYVVSKIGISQARRWFCSGERFSADEAMKMGLVHEIAIEDELDEVFQTRVKSFLKASPNAARVCKKLAKEFEDIEQYKEMTCQLIAKIRTSDQGQEGMKALLEKRKPNWIKS